MRGSVKDFLFVVFCLAIIIPKNISAADNEPTVSPDLFLPQDMIQLTEQLVEDVAEVEEEKREEENQVNIASELAGDPFVWGMGVMVATGIRYVVNEAIQKPGLTSAQSSSLNKNREKLESAKAELLAALEHFDREAGNKGLISKAWNSSKDFANGIVTGVLKKTADQNLRRLGEDRDLRKTSQDVRAKFDRFMAEVERSRVDKALGRTDSELEKFHEIESRLEESLKSVADEIIVGDQESLTLKGVARDLISAPSRASQAIRRAPETAKKMLASAPGALMRAPKAFYGFLVMSEARKIRQKIKEANQPLISEATKDAEALKLQRTTAVKFQDLLGIENYNQEIKNLLEKAHAHKIAVLEKAQMSEESALHDLKGKQLLKTLFVDSSEWNKTRDLLGDEYKGSPLPAVLANAQKDINDDDKRKVDDVLASRVQDEAADKMAILLQLLDSNPEKAAALQKYFKETHLKPSKEAKFQMYFWSRINEELDLAKKGFELRIKEFVNSKVPGQIRAENDFLEKFYEATGQTAGDKIVPADSRDILSFSKRNKAFYDRISDMEKEPGRFQSHETVVKALSQMEEELGKARKNERNLRFQELAREAKKYSDQYLNIAKRKKQIEEENTFHRTTLDNLSSTTGGLAAADVETTRQTIAKDLADRGMASQGVLSMEKAPSLIKRCISAIRGMKR